MGQKKFLKGGKFDDISSEWSLGVGGGSKSYFMIFWRKHIYVHSRLVHENGNTFAHNGRMSISRIPPKTSL